MVTICLIGKGKNMNKLITLALCGTILLSLTACGATSIEESNSKDQRTPKESVNTITNEEVVEIPNPFTEYETLQEAKTAVGFKVMVPTKIPEGYMQNGIYAVENNMVEIIYSNGVNQIRFRQGKGNEDISGDYREYSEVNTTTINGVEVTTKGNNSQVNVAIWTNGDYAFSIAFDSLEVGIENDKITEMISSIQ